MQGKRVNIIYRQGKGLDLDYIVEYKVSTYVYKKWSPITELHNMYGRGQ